MQRNILEYLETANEEFPDRTVYQDQADYLIVSEVISIAMRIGSSITRKVPERKPIVVIAGKNLETPVIYLGVVYAGCYYVPVSPELPDLRIKMMLDFIQPALIVTDDDNYQNIVEKGYPYSVVSYQEAKSTGIDEVELSARRQNQLDTDPLYVIFTSGSSGVPKGVVTAHRSVIDYIDTFADTFGISSDDILGNQAPLDYIAAIRDIYLPLRTGAKTVLIPKTLFSTPKALFAYVNEHKVTVICWVASVLSLCNELGVFQEITLETVKKVFFTGSVLACKHLRAWQENLPGAMFVNHYGPTEITASCSYYIVDHIVADDEVLPIGLAFENSDVFLLNEQSAEPTLGEIGEICVRGTGLALGYLKNQIKTEEAFILNPLNTDYPERIYKTGDLGSIGSDGMMRFHGRRDYQIKHMGHRIELGEIENAAIALKKVQRCCCLYHQDKEMIWLFFTGQTNSKEIAVHLRQLLPGYMVPR